MHPRYICEAVYEKRKFSKPGYKVITCSNISVICSYIGWRFIELSDKILEGDHSRIKTLRGDFEIHLCQNQSNLHIFNKNHQSA